MGMIGTPTSLSTQLNEVLEKALANPEYGVLDLECFIQSSTDPKLNIKVDLFDNLNIVQNFLGAYADFINIEFKLKPVDYVRMMKNSKGLRCVIKLYKYDKNLQKRDKIMMILNLMMIIRDKNDLLKKYSYGDLVSPLDDKSKDQVKAGVRRTVYEYQESLRIPISAHLIEDAVYAARKKKVNGIYRGVTVEDVMTHLTSVFGLKTIWVVPPDNKRVYTNFIIPPMYDVSNVYDFIQNDEGKGVYYKGLNYYITQNTMYIYPAFETNQTSPKTVHLYKVPENLAVGADNYHFEKDGEYHIIINTEVIDKEASDESIENLGTSILAMQCQDELDQWHTYVESKNELLIHEDNVILYDMDTKKGIVDKPYQPIFKYSHGNDFKLTTPLSFGDTIEMEAQWRHAVPFTFKPGWRVLYHYDGDDGLFQTRTATCHAVNYSIHKVSKLSTQLYGVSCRFRLRMTNRSVASPSDQLVSKLDSLLGTAESMAVDAAVDSAMSMASSTIAGQVIENAPI